ncbi:substrate-binding domain-containing protein, partial [Kitasatospora indigofera]|uniref:substrate-binding domain-containing protein n=1 Tax=Kitasatospora indigofera TaxID=67307 RepID=UPI0036B3A8CB
DNLAGGRLAAQHLIDHGITDIAYLGGAATGFTRINRQGGVAEVAHANGLTLNERWSVESGISSTTGYDMAAMLLADGPPPGAIICHSDAIAFGVMRALQDAGIAVGSDVRVVGFDDVPDAGNWSPSLTSISVATRQIGRDAARLLVDQMQGELDESPRSIVFQPQLKLRESCGHGA